LRLFSVLMPSFHPTIPYGCAILRLFSILLPHSTELLRVFASLFSFTAPQYRLPARFSVSFQF
jgi:hypothetical protein